MDPLTPVRFQHAGQLGPQAVIDREGNALAGASVLVLDPAGTTPALLYADRDRAAAAGNPVVLDESGTLRFFAEPGFHLLRVSLGGATVQESTVVVPVDPEDAVRQPYTVLRADDFGCVPDGRFLERVAMDAGSAVLQAPDGGLRASDVAKEIAVPGAADLQATITALVDRLDVRNASVAQGGTRLTGQPFDPRTGQNAAFRQEHAAARFRITVEGAGPDGTTLVSEIVALVDATTVELADAASVAVQADQNVQVVVNRSDAVALSNHARRTVTGVVATLTDRSVDDAQMTVGGRRLTSADARFSFLDLNTAVTVAGAGLLVTTIQSVERPTQATLSAPAQRSVELRERVAADVWRTDSRPGLEALLAALQTFDVESAEIRFGPGVYDFTRSDSQGSNLTAAIELPDVRNVTIRGAGPGATVLRLRPNQTRLNTHVVQTLRCRNLTIRDLSVHGAYLTMGATNEQMHGIQIDEGSQQIVVQRVRIFQSSGDGIRLLGTTRTDDPDLRVRRVWVDGCQLVQNKRSGVSFQRGVEFVWIRNCYIEMTPPSTDACIDFEPTGANALPPTDVVIDSNMMVHDTGAVAVSISGIGSSSPTRRVKFVNNTVLGGGLEGIHAHDVVVGGNTIEAPAGGRAVSFRGNWDGLWIRDNKLVAPQAPPVPPETEPTPLAAVVLTGLLRRPDEGGPLTLFSPTRVWIESNHIETGGSGIWLGDPGSHFEIRGNRVFGQGGKFGIRMRLETAGRGLRRDFRITGNVLVNFAEAGIHVSTFNTSESYEGVEISGNEILVVDDDLVDTEADPPAPAGISFPAPGGVGGRWLNLAVVTGNRFSDLVQTKIDRDGATVPFLGLGGNLGARAIFEGDGSPEGVVAAPVGSMFLGEDADGRGALYLKRTGDDSQTGWTALLTSTEAPPPS